MRDYIVNIIKINDNDNVAVAAETLKKGTVVSAGGKNIEVLQRIPAGHKIALAPIPAASPVIKYGYPIGNASADIQPGEWVHTHNLKTALAGYIFLIVGNGFLTMIFAVRFLVIFRKYNPALGPDRPEECDIEPVEKPEKKSGEKIKLPKKNKVIK